MDTLARAAGHGHGIFPTGLVVTLDTGDFDEMAAQAEGWDQSYTKLGRGAFQGRLAAAHTAGLQLATAAWSCSVRSIGSVPKGAQTLGLIRCGAGAPRHGGLALPPDHLAIASGWDELNFLTPGGCEMVLASFAPAQLDRVMAMLFGMSWSEASHAAPFMRLTDAPQVEASLRRLHAMALADPAALQDGARAQAIEDQAALTMLGRLALPPPRVPPAKRRRLARRSEDYLRANCHRAVSIGELCAATGAPERTLHLACREYFGLPPISFLRVLRLHGARRDLRTLGPATTVTDTATRWGFFHFGEFAAAYGHLFGERPSQTLCRAGTADPGSGRTSSPPAARVKSG